MKFKENHAGVQLLFTAVPALLEPAAQDCIVAELPGPELLQLVLIHLVTRGRILEISQQVDLASAEENQHFQGHCLPCHFVLVAACQDGLQPQRGQP